MTCSLGAELLSKPRAPHHTAGHARATGSFRKHRQLHCFGNGCGRRRRPRNAPVASHTYLGDQPRVHPTGSAFFPAICPSRFCHAHLLPAQTSRLQTIGGHDRQDASHAGSHPRGSRNRPPHSAFPRVPPNIWQSAATWADCGLRSAPHIPTLPPASRAAHLAGLELSPGSAAPLRALPLGTVFTAVPPSVSGAISNEPQMVHLPPSSGNSCFSATVPGT